MAASRQQDAEHARRLNRCKKAWDDSLAARPPSAHFGALFEALRVCQGGPGSPGGPPPLWLVEAFAAVVATARDDPNGLKRLWERHHQDVIDAIRADRVAEARRIGMSWPRAAAFVAATLESSPAGQRGGASAILKACQRVRSAQRQGSARYFMPFESQRYAGGVLEQRKPPLSQSAVDALRERFPEIQRHEGMTWLVEWLAPADRSGTATREAAREDGVPWPAVVWARRRLKVTIRGQWDRTVWSLPGRDCP